jgi:hypothetical protein
MNLALDTNCWNHPELQASPEHSKLAPIPEEEDEQGNFPAMNVMEPQDPVSWLIFSLLGHVYIVANRKKNVYIAAVHGVLYANHRSTNPPCRLTGSGSA